MSAKQAEPVFTRAQLCRAFGISSASLSRLVTNRVLPRPEHGAHEAIPATQAFLKFKISAATSKDRIEAARARKMERENDLAERKVAPLSLMSALGTQMAAAASAVVNRLPGRVAASVPSAVAAQVEAAVRLECAAVVAQWRSLPEKLFAELETPADPPTERSAARADGG